MTALTQGPTIQPQGSPNLLGPKLPIPPLGVKPATERPVWFVALVVLAQFALFVGLLGPVMLTMSLKVSTFTDDVGRQASMLA